MPKLASREMQSHEFPSTHRFTVAAHELGPMLSTTDPTRTIVGALTGASHAHNIRALGSRMLCLRTIIAHVRPKRVQGHGLYAS